MKKSKVFLATATAALAITAVFATKASKKFSAGFSTVVSGTAFKYVASSDLFTTVSNNGKTGINLVNYPQIYGDLYTAANHSVIGAITLKTAVSDSKIAYWKN